MSRDPAEHADLVGAARAAAGEHEPEVALRDGVRGVRCVPVVRHEVLGDLGRAVVVHGAGVVGAVTPRG